MFFGSEHHIRGHKEVQRIVDSQNQVMEKIWYWLASNVMPGIFKSSVYEYRFFLPYGKVKATPGLSTTAGFIY